MCFPATIVLFKINGRVSVANAELMTAHLIQYTRQYTTISWLRTEHRGVERCVLRVLPKYVQIYLHTHRAILLSFCANSGHSSKNMKTKNKNKNTQYWDMNIMHVKYGREYFRYCLHDSVVLSYI